MKAREQRATQMAAELIHAYLEMGRIAQSMLGDREEAMLAVMAGSWVLAGQELGESEDQDN